MKIEKREMTVRELIDYITMGVTGLAIIGCLIAPLLWLAGLI